MASPASAPRVVTILAAGLIALALGGLLFVWSGLYSVAASRGHWAIMDWFLAFAMRQSVETHTMGLKAPPLNSHDLVRLGAAHFHSGCAYCHGAPGTPISPIAKQMLPSPPELSEAVKHWTAEELFWIVKHGIKYTGMPGWVALERDDEVWAVVAFLKQLPDLNTARYRELALGPVRISDASGRAIATAQTPYDAVAACARCHGADENGPSSTLVPSLHGQPVEFLTAALRAYASGQRKSGIMQPVARELEPDELAKVAAYYAALPRPSLQSLTRNQSANIEAGRTLAVSGAPAAGIPPCLACHGSQALASYPRLAGQQADYMAGQLQLWKRGLNALSDQAAIMAPIALRLTQEQIQDVSAYFASLDPTSDVRLRPQ